MLKYKNMSKIKFEFDNEEFEEDINPIEFEMSYDFNKNNFYSKRYIEIPNYFNISSDIGGSASIWYDSGYSSGYTYYNHDYVK